MMGNPRLKGLCVAALLLLACDAHRDGGCEDICNALDECGFLPSPLGRDPGNCTVRCSHATKTDKSTNGQTGSPNSKAGSTDGTEGKAEDAITGTNADTAGILDDGSSVYRHVFDCWKGERNDAGWDPCGPSCSKLANCLERDLRSGTTGKGSLALSLYLGKSSSPQADAASTATSDSGSAQANAGDARQEQCKTTEGTSVTPLADAGCHEQVDDVQVQLQLGVVDRRKDEHQGEAMGCGPFFGGEQRFDGLPAGLAEVWIAVMGYRELTQIAAGPDAGDAGGSAPEAGVHARPDGSTPDAGHGSRDDDASDDDAGTDERDAGSRAAQDPDGPETAYFCRIISSTKVLVQAGKDNRIGIDVSNSDIESSMDDPPNQAAKCELGPSGCSNRVDDDDDGATDCADLQCMHRPWCATETLAPQADSMDAGISTGQ